MEKCRVYLVGDNKTGLIMKIPNFETKNNSLEHYLKEELGYEMSIEVMDFLYKDRDFVSFWLNENLNEKDIIIISRKMSRRANLEYKLAKEEERLKCLHGKDRYLRQFSEKTIRNAEVSMFSFRDYKKDEVSYKIYMDFIPLNF